MKITTTYAYVERQVFQFSQNDIQKALIDFAHIVEYRVGRTVEFEWDSDDGRLTATITLVFEKPTGDSEKLPESVVK